MDHADSVYREIRVPVAIFGTLRTALTGEAGALPTIHALHSAGYAAGTTAVEVFRSGPGEDIAHLDEETFWTRLSGFFAGRGWGSLRRSTEHPAVGLLESEDWAESLDAEPAEDGSCSFSAGFLSGLLSGLAGGPIAVLEVSCRSRGDDHCTFAFGSESAIHELYGRLLEDGDVEAALSAL